MSKAALKKGQPAKSIDAVTSMHEAALEKLKQMTPKEVFDVAVNAGIYTKSGKLKGPYQVNEVVKKTKG